MSAVKYQTMPPLSMDEYADLEASILANGIQVPILIDEHGVVIDGHHRKAIAEHHGLHLPSETRHMLTEAQKHALSIELNIARRQLNRDQKRAIVEAALKAQPEKSNREHAKTLGVDDKTVGSARARLESTAEIPQFDKTVGADGKERPATRPPTITVDDMTVDVATGEVIEPTVTEHTLTEKVKTTTRPEPKPVLTGNAAEQDSADTACREIGKALITLESFDTPQHRERVRTHWWPMGRDNIQPMHAALFTAPNIRRIAAALLKLADEMESNHA